MNTIWNLVKMVAGAAGVAGGIPTGYLMIGAVVASLTVLGGIWKAGYNYRGTLDESARLVDENARLKAASEEAARQMDSVNRIQQRDSDRAAELKKQLDKATTNVQITCDPSGPGVDASKLLDTKYPTVPPASGEHTASPGRRGDVRKRPNVAPGNASFDRSQPLVERGQGGTR